MVWVRKPELQREITTWDQIYNDFYMTMLGLISFQMGSLITKRRKTVRLYRGGCCHPSLNGHDQRLLGFISKLPSRVDRLLGGRVRLDEVWAQQRESFGGKADFAMSSSSLQATAAARKHVIVGISVHISSASSGLSFPTGIRMAKRAFT